MSEVVKPAKRCLGCLVVKLLDDFNYDRRARDSRRTRCRECERTASWRPSQKPRYVGDPAREEARRKLYVAVRDGAVVKPTACANCGTKGAVEGHHRDYRLPLKVTWLCRDCHKRMESLEREIDRLRRKNIALEGERDDFQRAFQTEVRVCSARTDMLQRAEAQLGVAREGLERIKRTNSLIVALGIARDTLARLNAEPPAEHSLTGGVSDPGASMVDAPPLASTDENRQWREAVKLKTAERWERDDSSPADPEPPADPALEPK